MLILVTNDDGIGSEGLLALADAMQPLGDVAVIAPQLEMSAIGHALTLQRPLRADEVRPGWYAIDGTPTDCVNLGVHGLLRRRPDLIVAGINLGANLADDLTYSGTVAAALEGAMMGVPAIAFSLDTDTFTPDDLRRAAAVASTLARRTLRDGLPADTFLNVNIPRGESQGLLLTRQGRRRYPEAVVSNRDPRGRTYYWLGSGDRPFEARDGSDNSAVEAGYVSVTPLHLDMTNNRALAALRRWNEEGGLDGDT